MVGMGNDTDKGVPDSIMAQSLTPALYKKYSELISIRDYENEEYCMICKKPFEDYGEFKMNIDHINNKQEDNELWNLWKLHSKCNQQKKRIQNMSTSKLAPGHLILIKSWEKQIRKNKEWQETYDFEKWSRKKQLEKTASVNPDEIYLDISHLLEKNTIEVLQEYITTEEDKAPLKELADIVAYRTVNKIGHGTAQAAANHIKTHCTLESKYKKYKEGISWYVCLR